MLFPLLERLAPVRSSTWVFVTWPGKYRHTLDNPRAVFEHIKDDAGIRKVILCRDDQDSSTVCVEGRNVVFVRAESIRGAYWVARCEFLLTGFGLSGVASYGSRITPKHRIIQLWHGVPLKRIGNLFPGESFWGAETPRYFATVCSSAEDRQIMARAFAPVPLERVWQFGLPRNDWLTKADNDLPADYRQWLHALRSRLAGRRLVLYAPTWRQSGPGAYPFSATESSQLASILKRHNAVLGVRAHSNESSRHLIDGSVAGGHFMILNDVPDVGVVLRLCNVLVTDYSSIYIDYLIADRPILHFVYDIDSYVDERGFLYDLDRALGSRPIRTFPELCELLDSALAGNDPDATHRHNAADLFHQHPLNSGKAVAIAIADCADT
jgi:CDP-glycerol glycerophosphotransferase